MAVVAAGKLALVDICSAAVAVAVEGVVVAVVAAVTGSRPAAKRR